MTLGELFEETYIQGEIAIRSYDSTGTTIEHYLGDAEEFYPDEHPQILERGGRLYLPAHGGRADHLYRAEK